MALAFASLICVMPTQQAMAQTAKKTSDLNMQDVSYSLGYMMSAENKKVVANLDLNEFFKGFKDGFKQKEGRLTDKQRSKILQEYAEVHEKEVAREAKKLAKKNLKLGKAFLAKNKHKKGVQTTASGLQYRVINKGHGKSPTATDIVSVSYKGTFINGKVFDSSDNLDDKKIEFPLTDVIKGWTEGLQLMKKGAKYEFFIPSELAYGENGNPSIEPNSTLIFTVELHDFRPKK